MTPAALHILSDQATWTRLTATAIVQTLRDAIDCHGNAYWVLSGGRTPQDIYAYIAAHLRDRLPWNQVHLFWGDERYVPHDDPRSNYAMAQRTMLQHLPIPTENVHPMPTYVQDPDLAAQAYETTLRRFFTRDFPQFDLILLGVGEDGHIASLFPNSPALEEQSRWVTVSQGPDVIRLTLTYPAINHAAHIFILVRGKDKARVVRQALLSQDPIPTCPVRGIQPVHGDVHWWLDEAAARDICTGVNDDEATTQ